ncbi:MAG: hypothetical protein WBO70_00930 [Erysipelotrichaceae bacterium]
MKASFEFYITFYLIMFFVIISLSLVNIMMVFNQTNLFGEYVVDIIEDEDGYSNIVDQRIKEKGICRKCTYTVKESLDNKYEVVVNYPITIPFIKLNYNFTTKFTTIII